MIRGKGVIRIEEICRQLRVSPATVRRDLDQLEKAGAIRRVHGGAVSVESRLEEPLFDDKASIAAREKQRIAEAALQFVEPGRHDLSGWRQHGAGVRAAVARPHQSHGGDQFAARGAGTGRARAAVDFDRRRTAPLEPDDGRPVDALPFAELHLDKAFMGTIGLALKEGLTTTDPSEAYTKELVMSRARQVILLADSGKAGKVAFARAGGLEHVHALVTDKSLDKTFAKELTKKGIKVVKV